MFIRRKITSTIDFAYFFCSGKSYGPRGPKKIERMPSNRYRRTGTKIEFPRKKHDTVTGFYVIFSALNCPCFLKFLQIFEGFPSKIAQNCWREWNYWTGDIAEKLNGSLLNGSFDQRMRIDLPVPFPVPLLDAQIVKSQSQRFEIAVKSQPTQRLEIADRLRTNQNRL